MRDSFDERAPQGPWLSGRMLRLFEVLLFLTGIVVIAFPAEGETGKDWTEASHSAPWRARAYQSSTVYDNGMWVVGGSSGPFHPLGDVWTSRDGVLWMSVAYPPYRDGTDGECMLTTLVFRGKLWAIAGGGAQQLTHNEVFSTLHGSNWVKEHDLPYGTRDHSSVVSNDKMWIFGGHWDDGENSGDYDRIAWSSDGTSWTVTTGAPWGERCGQSTVVFHDKIWLLGGERFRTSFNDIWQSDDGIDWTLVTAAAPWAPRLHHTCVVANDRIWVVGGQGVSAGLPLFNDVWSSPDGVNWTEVTQNAPWLPRSGHTSVVYDNKIWVIGGEGRNGVLYYNDVWYSELPPAAAGFAEPPRAGWVEEGEPWTVSVTVADASGPVTYQWLKDGVAIPDATNAEFTIESLTPDDTGT